MNAVGPSRAGPLRWLTAACLLGFPVASFLYYPRLLASGTLPPDGDSIAIPMFASIVLAILLAGPVLCVTWFCTRRYNPATRLLAWRRDRPLRSATATLLFGGTAGLFPLAVAADLATGAVWWEQLFAWHAVACILWLLVVRAALIEQLERERTATVIDLSDQDR